MKTLALLILVALGGCASPRGTAFSRLPAVLEPLWTINGIRQEPQGGSGGVFSLRYSESSPADIHLPHWRRILYGDSSVLLACHGAVLPGGKPGFVVGSAKMGPTMGNLSVYDEQLKLVGTVGCQRVARMKLVDLLGDGTQEIVTWEDHHYGTCTTRRMLNIYRVDTNNLLQCVFEHDLYVPGDRLWLRMSEGCLGASMRYDINFTARLAQRQIVVICENEREVYSWNGSKYERDGH